MAREQRQEGLPPVKWNAVINEKRFGGLVIKNLKNQSKALRMTWLWKYSNENQSLWSRVIRVKYEENDNWMTKEVTTPYSVSLWKSIRILWNEFEVNTTVKVADGVKTVFWKDDWHGAGRWS